MSKLKIRNRESFESLMMEILGPHALARAIYLIDHGRIREVPKEMRQQIGILMSRKWMGYRKGAKP